MSQHTNIFDLQFDEFDQFYIPIQGFQTLEKRTKFTVYKLKVENIRTGIFWHVYRRFTDFQRLDDKLKSKFPKLDLSLPRKSFFENIFNPLFLEKRQLGLQLYLNQLMSNKELLKELSVRRFLCIDEPPLSNSKFPSSNETYSSSIYSQSNNQLFVCNNCYLLEKKLTGMQEILETKDDKIKELENALGLKNLISS